MNNNCGTQLRSNNNIRVRMMLDKNFNRESPESSDSDLSDSYDSCLDDDFNTMLNLAKMKKKVKIEQSSYIEPDDNRMGENEQPQDFEAVIKHESGDRHQTTGNTEQSNILAMKNEINPEVTENDNAALIASLNVACGNNVENDEELNDETIIAEANELHLSGLIPVQSSAVVNDVERGENVTFNYLQMSDNGEAAANELHVTGLIPVQSSAVVNNVERGENVTFNYLQMSDNVEAAANELHVTGLIPVQSSAVVTDFERGENVTFNNSQMSDNGANELYESGLIPVQSSAVVTDVERGENVTFNYAQMSDNGEAAANELHVTGLIPVQSSAVVNDVERGENVTLNYSQMSDNGETSFLDTSIEISPDDTISNALSSTVRLSMAPGAFSMNDSSWTDCESDVTDTNFNQK